MKNIVLSKHAKEQLALRRIDEKIVWKILSENKPYQTGNDLTVYHGEVIENDKSYLIRIFVNEAVNPNLVVTAYKTSKIYKYL